MDYTINFCLHNALKLANLPSCIGNFKLFQGLYPGLSLKGGTDGTEGNVGMGGEDGKGGRGEGNCSNDLGKYMPLIWCIDACTPNAINHLD